MMTADQLDIYISRSSAATVLTMYDTRVLLFLSEGLQLPAKDHRNADICLYVIKTFQHGGGQNT